MFQSKLEFFGYFVIIFRMFWAMSESFRLNLVATYPK